MIGKLGADPCVSSMSRAQAGQGLRQQPRYAECAERGCAAIIPLRKGQPERKLRIPRSSDEWRSLYRRRSAVEREFGRLKHDYGLAFVGCDGSSASVSTPTL